MDKAFIRRRLAWITTVKADANPSRSTLQAVNAFLMKKPNWTSMGNLIPTFKGLKKKNIWLQSWLTQQDVVLVTFLIWYYQTLSQHHDAEGPENPTHNRSIHALWVASPRSRMGNQSEVPPASIFCENQSLENTPLPRDIPNNSTTK